jgi:hypothetical protein
MFKNKLRLSPAVSPSLFRSVFRSVSSFLSLLASPFLLRQLVAIAIFLVGAMSLMRARAEGAANGVNVGLNAGVHTVANPGAILEGDKNVSGVTPESPIRVHLTQRALWASHPAATASSDAVSLQYVRPGNVVEYHAQYTNASTEAVRVQALLPVPAHTEYIAYSARSSGNFAVHMAAANGEYAAEPLQQSVVDTQQQKISVPVPYAQYRAVRWQLGLLAPGKSEWVALRVRVAQVAP